MAKFKKKEDYDLQPEHKQEILAEEMKTAPINPLDMWELWCSDLTNTLNGYRGLVSDSLIDETILSVSKTITLTARVKVKLQR